MPIIVKTTAEIDPLLERVRAAATRTVQALARLTAEETDGLRVLRRLKFTEMAWHPIDDRPLNLVEQINQTWPYLVTLKALPILFERHPEAGGFRLNLGTEGGTDIESLSPNVVAAETFAAAHPSNNGKLMKECGNSCVSARKHKHGTCFLVRRGSGLNDRNLSWALKCGASISESDLRHEHARPWQGISVHVGKAVSEGIGSGSCGALHARFRRTLNRLATSALWPPPRLAAIAAASGVPVQSLSS